MIKRGLASALGGTVDMCFKAKGLQVIVDAPALEPAFDEQNG